VSGRLRVRLVADNEAELAELRRRVRDVAVLEIVGEHLINEARHDQPLTLGTTEVVLMTPRALARSLSGVPAPEQPRASSSRQASGAALDIPVEQLTSRERAVLALVADGLGNREIAHALDISEHTVKFHLASIFGKLAVSSRTEAVRRGLQLGLIEI
jgi:ATP/maltotriose-dependent transcriptional regulator MalT